VRIPSRVRGEESEDPEDRPGSRAEEGEGDHTMSKKHGRIGSSFEDFLKEEGTLEETNAVG